MSAGLKYMLFESGIWGHHMPNLRLAAQFWVKVGLPGHLDLIVSRGFYQAHPAFTEWCRQHAGAGISLHEQMPYEPQGEGIPALVRRDFFLAEQVAEAVRRHRPDHCVLMAIDPMQLSLATRRFFRGPTRYSGIYFRPFGHEAGTGSLKQRLSELRKRGMMKAALSNPHFERLLCFDPYSVGAVKALHPGAEVVYLPDAIEPGPDTSVDLHARYGIETGRKIFLTIGALSLRKGIVETCRAAATGEPRLREQICLLFVGKMEAEERPRLEEALDEARRAGIQVVLDDRFVGDDEVQPIVRAADVIMMTYLGHAGSSGILARAALASRPVIASDYGLVGRLTKKLTLGRAVREGDVPEIRSAMEHFLNQPETFPFDPAAAARLASVLTPENFGATLFSAIPEAAALRAPEVDQFMRMLRGSEARP